MTLKELRQFKQDFIRANLLDYIKKDFEIIMVWLAGSALTKLDDSKSDYDLGVLIADDTISTRTNRNEDYFIYKPLNKRVQWIYDTVEDITTQQDNANQKNIGWAQLRCLTSITDEHILYINPKYYFFVKELIAKKYEVSEYSFWLYLQTKKRGIDEILKLNTIPPKRQVKILYHFCWAADILENKEVDINFIKRVKLLPHTPISAEDLQKVVERIKVVVDYFKKHKPKCPVIRLERS